MSNVQKALDSASGGTAGLPFTMLVKVSHPTASAAAAADWMTTNAALAFSTESSANGACTVASFKIKKFQQSGEAFIEYVQDDQADARTALAATWVKHVQKVHDARLGTQSGWVPLGLLVPWNPLSCSSESQGVDGLHFALDTSSFQVGPVPGQSRGPRVHGPAPRRRGADPRAEQGAPLGLTMGDGGLVCCWTDRHGNLHRPRKGEGRGGWVSPTTS